ncbi:hypothetical protein GCM10027360_95440 [Amycolatopsis echigonensis]
MAAEDPAERQAETCPGGDESYCGHSECPLVVVRRPSDRLPHSSTAARGQSKADRAAIDNLR